MWDRTLRHRRLSIWASFVGHVIRTVLLGVVNRIILPYPLGLCIAVRISARLLFETDHLLGGRKGATSRKTNFRAFKTLLSPFTCCGIAVPLTKLERKENKAFPCIKNVLGADESCLKYSAGEEHPSSKACPGLFGRPCLVSVGWGSCPFVAINLRSEKQMCACKGARYCDGLSRSLCSQRLRQPPVQRASL